MLPLLETEVMRMPGLPNTTVRGEAPVSSIHDREHVLAVGYCLAEHHKKGNSYRVFGQNDNLLHTHDSLDELCRFPHSNISTSREVSLTATCRTSDRARVD
eukprot:GHVT01071775.1.p3 GENE.GHVT01071775.1~~GHVT01071775.1.p3  ORF type:complete len:101 (-),score=1.82 GHVT01071775.1:731-1033(-)